MDHKSALEDAARLLNQTRNCSSSFPVKDLQLLKTRLESCQEIKDVCEVVIDFPGMREYLGQLERSSIVEEMLGLCRSYNQGPLMCFPPSVNSNMYVDIVKYGIERAPKLITLLLDLQTDKDKCITAQNVVKIAFSFSHLAMGVNNKLSAVNKVKSLALRTGGLSNEGLDFAAMTGMVQTSRSARDQRDFLASISWSLISNQARQYPHQATLDNLDFKRNDLMHHMTLCFIEVEQECTKDLDTESLHYEDMMNNFSLDLILIKSKQNKSEYEHLLKVVTITLGRIFAASVPGYGWMKKFLPNHYTLPESVKEVKPSICLTKKPLYLQETSNNDIVKIVQQEQLDFLLLVAEQMEDKIGYLKDLDVIRDKDCPRERREGAEDRIHAAVKFAGEFIGHGDQLTRDRFYIAKRLRRSAVTAFERLDFVTYFCTELFHLKMNKEGLIHK